MNLHDVFHRQILRAPGEGSGPGFQGPSTSADAPKGHREHDSGHRVPILEAALAVCEAVVARDPHLAARALDLAGLVRAEQGGTTEKAVGASPSSDAAAIREKAVAWASVPGLVLRLCEVRDRLRSAIADDDPHALIRALDLADLVDELEALTAATRGGRLA